MELLSNRKKYKYLFAILRRFYIQGLEILHEDVILETYGKGNIGK